MFEFLFQVVQQWFPTKTDVEVAFYVGMIIGSVTGVITANVVRGAVAYYRIAAIEKLAREGA